MKKMLFIVFILFCNQVNAQQIIPLSKSEINEMKIGVIEKEITELDLIKEQLPLDFSDYKVVKAPSIKNNAKSLINLSK